MVLLRLTDVRPDPEIAALLKSTVADAEQEWAPLKYEGQYPTAGFGITELRPKHVRYVNPDNNVPSTVYWAASIATASAWFYWFNVTLTDMAYIMPTGVFNLDGGKRVTHLKPSANGQELPIVNMEQLYSLDIARAWFEKPYCARPNNNLGNRLIARYTGIEHIGLMGYCIAKRSYLILE